MASIFDPSALERLRFEMEKDICNIKTNLVSAHDGPIMSSPNCAQFGPRIHENRWEV